MLYRRNYSPAPRLTTNFSYTFYHFYFLTLIICYLLLKVIKQYERAVVFHLGRLNKEGEKQPGNQLLLKLIAKLCV